MRRTKRHPLLFDHLEDKTLLSAMHPHALRARAVAAPAIQPAQANNPNLPSTTSSDVQGLQQHASSDNLVVFLSNLAEVMSNRPSIQQFATQVLNTHESSDQQIDMAAMSANILLPADISESSDQNNARQVLQSVNTANFDQTFLTVLAQVEDARATAATQLVNQTQNNAIKQAVQPEIADDTQTAQQARTLLNNLGPVGSLSQPNGPATPTNDGQYVQAAHSTNLNEILLSQAAALTSSRNDVQLYAQKLISDHHQGDLQANELASYLGIQLSPILSPTDLQSARSVLSTLPTSSTGDTANFDQAYLSTNVQAHQMDIATNQAEIARSTDPNVIQYAKDDIPTDNLHLIGAQTLLLATPFNGFQNSGVTNVRVRFRHPGNGTLNYNVTFDANGFRFTQNYSLNVQQIGSSQPGGFNSRDAVTLFLRSLYSRIQQGNGNNNGGTGGINNGGIAGLASHHRIHIHAFHRG